MVAGNQKSAKDKALKTVLKVELKTGNISF